MKVRSRRGSFSSVLFFSSSLSWPGTNSSQEMIRIFFGLRLSGTPFFYFSSVCSEDQEAIQAQKIWKKAIMLVWRAAANHR